ncbi:DUF4158 domain-containing protein [Streptomyces sp. NPDC085479]|uniref:DUF4158 domain-containing protein n=1 Tax=Streptomyces sp. NPDC085479 TaxID=3365726 RepID=UPI0037D19717
MGHGAGRAGDVVDLVVRGEEVTRSRPAHLSVDSRREGRSEATRVFSDEELDALRSFPTIGKDELIRYFTLTSADEAFLRKFRRAQNVLGAAVQLSALPRPVLTAGRPARFSTDGQPPPAPALPRPGRRRIPRRAGAPAK